MKKKILLPALVACLIIPCTVLMTACGGNILGKTKTNKDYEVSAFTKEYGAGNYVSVDTYDEHLTYRYYPTVLNNEAFEQITIEYATPFSNFYTYAWENQPCLQTDGSFTIYDGGEIRINYSFNLYKENTEYARANLSLNNSINNNAVGNSRNISQILTHSNNVKVIVTRKSVSIVYGETKLELAFESPLSENARVSTASAYYNTNLTEGTFFKFTFEY